MPALSSSFYRGKMILAPMVRTNAIPFRALALKYGADVVYSEEIVDRKIIGCRRVVNSALRTIDYIHRDNSLVLRIDPHLERGRLIFQMGTASPEFALKAALTVAQDVHGIDVNCGCPKRFSLQGGMGAALLKKPDLLCEILRTLVQHSGKPVTCKIRILNTVEETVDLVQRLAATGIQAIAVHCRRTAERPSEPGHWDYFRPIVDAVPHIPIIANGDFHSLADAQRMMSESGVASVMFARGAQWNASVFRKEGMLPLREVMQAYARLAVRYENLFQNCKYVLQSMSGGGGKVAGQHEEMMRPMHVSKTKEALFACFGVDEREIREWEKEDAAVCSTGGDVIANGDAVTAEDEPAGASTLLLKDVIMQAHDESDATTVNAIDDVSPKISMKRRRESNDDTVEEVLLNR